MNSEDTIIAIRKEMNRRRRHGGAEDVPSPFWGYAEVDQAVLKAARCADTEGFDGDWDTASVSLDEHMDSLAKTLRRIARQSASLGVFNGADGNLARSARMARSSQSRSMEDDVEGWGRYESRPAIVRHDAGSRGLAAYLTWYLRNDGAAQSYRESICGGDYLTPEEAWLFLTSSLPKVMTQGDYHSLGLCPARTTGRVLSKYLIWEGQITVTNWQMVDPQTNIPAAIANTLKAETGCYCVEVRLPDEDTKTRLLKRMVLNRSEKEFTYVAHLYSGARPYRIADYTEFDFCYPPEPAPFFADKNRYVEGYTESVMGELINMANLFCDRFAVTIWDMLEAFLTGQFPPQSAIEMFPETIQAQRFDGFDEVPSKRKENRFAAQGPVSLTVQPWVTPEVLADAWREHRKTNPCYSPSEKQVEALQFVLSHTPPGEEFAWERLAAQWEEERGERMTRGQLCKQFQRARAAILPGYEEEGTEHK